MTWEDHVGQFLSHSEHVGSSVGHLRHVGPMLGQLGNCWAMLVNCWAILANVALKVDLDWVVLSRRARNFNVQNPPSPTNDPEGTF